jgi:hypothetical protein
MVSLEKQKRRQARYRTPKTKLYKDIQRDVSSHTQLLSSGLQMTAENIMIILAPITPWEALRG